ncbi:alternative ribosome rescue aminoacyl-tRNA hydrolase ArfB [Sphingomonas crocodyli]|uniref:Aminoacyl-tRNA hydrolase n=1 Tax=Sphingomonas crocodyli TaxID=1979270 RepID=A0A437LV43_9SPHN|nr:alternative ribosome rescue aminoacyl-tRNA hydrolase ArfB [Sphingomonas crocodyli]RVT89163.1 aminoacyl-tRNA hydrolase [Sphingomonas crocodyli]
MPKTEAPALPESAIEERFLAATGPGGQNVNKVATAAQIRLDVFALGLAPDVYRRLKALAGSKWTNEGEIVITARSHRTREANREDGRRRLADLVAAAHVRPERRVKTKPSKAAKAKRVEAKTSRGQIKRGRARPNLE